MGGVLANHIYDKRLISKIYKDVIQLNRKKSSLNMGKKVWADVFQRRHTESQQGPKEGLHIPRHWEMQIKTTFAHLLAWLFSRRPDRGNSVRMWRKGNTCALLVGMDVGTAIKKNKWDTTQPLKRKSRHLWQRGWTRRTACYGKCQRRQILHDVTYMWNLQNKKWVKRIETV